MVSNFLDAIRPPSRWWPVTHLRSVTRPQRRYAAIGAMVGVINMTLMLTLFKSPTPERLFFLLLTIVALSLVPIFPIWGSLGYLTLWIVLLQVPHVPSSDMTITNAAFYFFLATFLPLRVALILALIVPAALIIPTGPLPDAVSQLFLAACTLLPGSVLRHTETSLREEVSTATEKLKSIRSEIAREMHDLVAYSMSQTALRAQRAAADPSYPVAAQQEFAAIESTATDALHELRLVLRALRSNEDERTDHAGTTGLGTVVLDLEESVRAVADDLSASGYSVTYQCMGRRALHSPSSCHPFPGASGDELQCPETCGPRSTGHHHPESRRSQGSPGCDQWRPLFASQVPFLRDGDSWYEGKTLNRRRLAGYVDGQRHLADIRLHPSLTATHPSHRG